MSWQYRLVCHDAEVDKTYYTIQEIYYDKKSIIGGWSQRPEYPHGETLQEFLDCFDAMIRCVKDMPVVMLSKLEERYG